MEAEQLASEASLSSYPPAGGYLFLPQAKLFPALGGVGTVLVCEGQRAQLQHSS